MTARGDDVSLLVSRAELQILIGGVHEALFELGDEFHVRVGESAAQARELMARLVAVRNACDSELANDPGGSEEAPTPGG